MATKQLLDNNSAHRPIFIVSKCERHLSLSSVVTSTLIVFKTCANQITINMSTKTWRVLPTDEVCRQFLRKSTTKQFSAEDIVNQNC